MCKSGETETINQRDSLSVLPDSSYQTLKSRHYSLSSVQPAKFPLKVIRCSEWRKRLCDKPHIGIISLHEEVAKRYDSPWTMWKCLNRLRTVYTCSKEQRKKWKFYTGDTTEETIAHLYNAPNLHIPAPSFNEVRKQCA